MKAVLYVIGLLLYVTHLCLNPPQAEVLYELAGPVIASIQVWLLNPLVYLLMAVDFAGVYVGIICLLPLKIRQMGLIDFRDPLGYDQLKPRGNLIRDPSSFYFAGLAAYGVWITSGGIIGAPSAITIEAVNTGAFVGGTVLGNVFFFLPIILQHGY